MGWKLQRPESPAPIPANTDTFVATDATNPWTWWWRLDPEKDLLG
ncbi:MAG: hypothetical protein ACYCSP_02450 [Acidobacteriaceae bacterium]